MVTCACELRLRMVTWACDVVTWACALRLGTQPSAAGGDVVTQAVVAGLVAGVSPTQVVAVAVWWSCVAGGGWRCAISGAAWCKDTKTAATWPFIAKRRGCTHTWEQRHQVELEG